MNSNLDILFKLLHDPSMKDKGAIINKIDASLSNITATNFHLYGKQIVIYGDILYEHTYDEKGRIKNQKYYEKLNNLYKHLRIIDKLSVDRDITKFVELVDQIISIMHTSGKFAHNTKNGSFCYYFFINRFNKFITECKGFIGPLIESLIPNHIDYIEEQNLERCIILAIQGFKEDIVQQFMLYFHNNKRVDSLNLFMQYALQYGRCETVEWLLNKNISLPSEIEKVILSLQIAVIIDNKKVIKAIQDKFPVEDIIAHCIKKRLYDIAKIILKKLEIGAITFHGLTLVTELAAACGDIEALKVFLEKCKPSDREALFNQHILPFYVPTDDAENIGKDINLQKLFNQKFAKMVAIISFYMRDNRFNFTLEKTKEDNFTLANCGELRKLIAYAHKEENRHAFGTIRFTTLSTPLFGILESYGKRTDEIVEKQGKETKNKYLLLVNKLKDHHIYVQLPKGKVKLSIYRKPSSSGSANKIHTLWKHTRPKYFPIILNYTQDLWLQFNQLRKRQHDLKLRIAALKYFAEIHYYSAPPCFYKRGSATVAEAIISGACVTVELDELRKHQRTRPDCEAILASSCAEFIENYPKFHGFNNYEEMAIKLHETFVVRMSRKDDELSILKSFIKNNCKTSPDSSDKIMEQLKSVSNNQTPTITSTNTNSTRNTDLCNKLEKLDPVGDKQNSLLYRDFRNLSEINIDRPFYGNSIDELIKELNEKGPVMAMGYYGQTFYTSNIVSIAHDFASTAIKVNGWPPNSYKENKSVDPQKIIIVGARKEGEKKFVYYISSSDTKQSQLFVISHARYIESRKNMVAKQNLMTISVEVNNEKNTIPNLGCQNSL